jgi:hypothetical protein
MVCRAVVTRLERSSYGLRVKEDTISRRAMSSRFEIVITNTVKSSLCYCRFLAAILEQRKRAASLRKQPFFPSTFQHSFQLYFPMRDE